MHQLIDIPLSEIRDDALLRDRSVLDPASLADLTLSIAADGLRQPVEVWQLSQPTDTHRYGLISGLRRLTAFRALAHGRTDTRFATIPAFLRTPADMPAAMAAMVTENEIRSQITPWEKGRLIIQAVTEGIFPTPDAAVAALYPTFSRQRRARLRAFASVVEALDGSLTEPESLTAQRMESIALVLRGDIADLLRAALGPVRGQFARNPVVRHAPPPPGRCRGAGGRGGPRRRGPPAADAGAETGADDPARDDARRLDSAVRGAGGEEGRADRRCVRSGGEVGGGEVRGRPER